MKAVLISYYASNLKAKGFAPGEQEQLDQKRVEEIRAGFLKADSRLHALFWSIIERKLVGASLLQTDGEDRHWQPPEQDSG